MKLVKAVVALTLVGAAVALVFLAGALTADVGRT